MNPRLDGVHFVHKFNFPFIYQTECLLYGSFLSGGCDFQKNKGSNRDERPGVNFNHGFVYLYNDYLI